MIVYYPFSDIEKANACSQALYSLGRPYKHFRNDVGTRLFESIELPDGRGALALNLNHEVVIHRDGIDPNDPISGGTVGVLRQNLAGEPSPEELAAWEQLATTILALPQRGDPSLNGLEPVVRVRLGDMLPASAHEHLMTQLPDSNIADE